MRAISKRLGTTVAGVALGLALIGASPAAAAVEVGSDCEANGMVVGATLFPLTVGPDNSLPISVPASGVATKWRVRSPSSDVHTEKLKVFRPTFAPNQVQVIAESNLENVTEGHETFDIRIPVQTGDRFGVTGKFGEGAIACIPGRSGDVSGIFVGESPPGSTQTFSESGSQAAVSAVIEPDKDGDGYGDETQDKCPQGAAYQGECPAIALDTFPIVLKRSVLVLVSASSSSAVHVFGQVGWKAKPRGGARSSKVKPGGGPATTGLIVGLTGGTQTVNPGEVANFNVKLPKSVKRRLGRIPPSKSLKAQLTASTTDLAGRVSTSVLTVKLPGQDRK